MNTQKTPKKWFADVIGQELTILCYMRLEGHPSEQILNEAIKDVWVDTLWDAHEWKESHIFQIQAAFKLVRKNSTKWIQPVQFINDYLQTAGNNIAREKLKVEGIKLSALSNKKKIELIQSLEISPIDKKQFINEINLLALPNQVIENKENDYPEEKEDDYPEEKAAENRAKIKEMLSGMKFICENPSPKVISKKEKWRREIAEESKRKMEIEYLERMAKIEEFSVENGGTICTHTGFNCVYFQDFTEALAYQLALAYSKGRRPKATEQERHAHANRTKKKFLPEAIKFLRK